MNIILDIEDSLSKRLNKYASEMDKSRNALICEAINAWLERHEIKQWPSSILTFTGIENTPSFESHRSDLLPSKKNPLA